MLGLQNTPGKDIITPGEDRATSPPADRTASLPQDMYYPWGLKLKPQGLENDTYPSVNPWRTPNDPPSPSRPYSSPPLGHALPLGTKPKPQGLEYYP